MIRPVIARYGVKETTPASRDPLDIHAEECRILGLYSDQISAIGTAIDRVIAQQKAECGGPAVTREPPGPCTPTTIYF
jgi:hypothetical protein